MKKVMLAFLAIGVLATSCNTDNTKTEENNTIVTPKTECTYSIKGKPYINWTAFKTTEKIGVKGSFDQVNLVTQNSTASSIEELISDASFNINTSSINSKNEERDAKLVKFFFQKMDKSESITGDTGTAANGKIQTKILMNGMKSLVVFSYSLMGDDLILKGIINLNNFQAEKAIESLNEACNELHKGADGVSKTWPEVEVSLTVKIAQNNCD